jgi:hypothetical protein
MRPTRRLRLLEVLERQNQLNIEADMQKLRAAITVLDESTRNCLEAEGRVTQAVEQVRRQSSPGQLLDLELARNSVSYALQCMTGAEEAQKSRRAAEHVVEERRKDVAKLRVRREKLEDRNRDERQRIATEEVEKSQHEVDEAWLLSNGAEGGSQ